MPNRGQACRRKRRALLVTLICLAAATCTGFYVVHLKRGSASSQAARNAGVAVAATTLPEKDASLQVVIVEQPHTTQALRGSGQLAQAVRDDWASETDGGEQQDLLDQEASKKARGRIGQHDDFLVILSVDQDKQELLQNKEQLWQVCHSFPRTSTDRLALPACRSHWMPPSKMQTGDLSTVTAQQFLHAWANGTCVHAGAAPVRGVKCQQPAESHAA